MTPGACMAASLGSLCALLPCGGPPLEVDGSEPISAVCRLLHERGQTICAVRPAVEGGDRRLFRLPDLCSALLDALRADPLAARVLKVLGASAVRDLAQREAFHTVSAAEPLAAQLPRLAGERCGRLLVLGEGGEALRLFGCEELLELLLRHGRASCQALQDPARGLALLAAVDSNAAAVKTAGAAEPVLRCFQDLKTLGLQGLAVVDDAEPRQGLLEKALGTITPNDVRHFFLRPPDEAAVLVSCTAREFVVHEMQELATPRGVSGCGHLGDIRYPFLHADVEHSLETVASKLLASRTSCIALCSQSQQELRAMVTAHDIVRALRSQLAEVVFVASQTGIPASPRMWPSPMAAAAPLLLAGVGGEEKPQELPYKPKSEARFGASQHRVGWVDEQRGERLAEIFEYTAEAPTSPTAGPSAPLALEDAPVGALGPGDIVKLPQQPFRALEPPQVAESPPSSAEHPLTSHVLSELALQTPALPRVEGPLPLTPQDSALQAVLSREGGPWQQLGDGAQGSLPSPCPSHGSGHGALQGQAVENLQLVLYQQRDLVLYDRRQNRAYARRLTEEQAGALAQSRHSYCPLCRQHLDPSWAFIVEGYFDMLAGMNPPSDASMGSAASSAAASPPAGAAAGAFSSNEEAAAAAGLHNIPMGLMNCGYYGRFFVEERKLGAGSFGAVYLCRHVMDEIELGVFAVKKLALGDDTKRLRQVVREVKALERLRHMNIIDYKHSWLEISRHSEFCPYVPFLFILMEYCNAGSLEDLIWPKGFVRGAAGNAAKATMLTEELIWLLFLDICHGLKHLHSRGILHRDLKPSNILLNVDEVAGDPTGDGRNEARPVPRALLSDFGTCEILGEGAVSGHVHGGYAIEFMAPERLRGEESDEPADMWSAGLVLYAMCYGDLPYHSEDPITCRSKVMDHSVLSDLPDFRAQALRGLISALTARSPVARPTAEEAERVSAQAVARCREEGEVSAFSAGRSPQVLPSLPPPLPLELTDGGLEPLPACSEQPPAKILRITSASSLEGASDALSMELAREREELGTPEF